MRPGSQNVVRRYVAGRLGFVGLFVLVGGLAFRLAGGRGSRKASPDAAGARPGPASRKDVGRFCRRQGWPERLPTGIPERIAAPRELPGAFPPEGRLGRGALGLAPLRAEFRNPATLLRRRAALLERLATGLAVRARYFYHLSKVLPDRPTARSRRQAAGRRLGRHLYTRAAALQRFARAAALADYYYRRVSGRLAKYVDVDRLAYEHAALLLYVGQEDQATKILEGLLADMPDSRYAGHVRAYLALVALAQGRCRRAEELAGRTSGLGPLGSLGGAVAAGLGRCALSERDPSRALGLARRALELLTGPCVPPGGSCRPWMARALLVALGAFAEGAAAAGAPAQLADEARKLPAPLAALVPELVLASYQKKAMVREALELCRLAGKAVKAAAGKAARVWSKWRKVADLAGQPVPGDRRVALKGRAGAGASGLRHAGPSFRRNSAQGQPRRRRRGTLRRQGGNRP